MHRLLSARAHLSGSRTCKRPGALQAAALQQLPPQHRSPAVHVLHAQNCLQGVESCYVSVHDAGQPALTLLATALPACLRSLSFAKTMRWRPHSAAAFSRPLRWITALHGSAVVPFAFCGLASGRTSRLMRGHADAELASAAGYESALEGVGIVVDVAQRREAIWRGVCVAAQVRRHRLCAHSSNVAAAAVQRCNMRCPGQGQELLAVCARYDAGETSTHLLPCSLHCSTRGTSRLSMTLQAS